MANLALSIGPEYRPRIPAQSIGHRHWPSVLANSPQLRYSAFTSLTPQELLFALRADQASGAAAANACTERGIGSPPKATTGPLVNDSLIGKHAQLAANGIG